VEAIQLKLLEMTDTTTYAYGAKKSGMDTWWRIRLEVRRQEYGMYSTVCIVSASLRFGGGF
jgi:hypothetical protein